MVVDLKKLDSLVPSKPIEKKEELNPQLKLFDDGRIECWYAPLGKINHNAKIAIFGLTPGWTQMKVAYKIAARNKSDKFNKESLSKIAFYGSMRKNLIKMLDEIGVSAKLNVNSFISLFGTEIITYSSVLKYPVFVNGKNYSGYSPQILKHPYLKDTLNSILMSEVKQLKDCLLIPLGKVSLECLEYIENKLGHNNNIILKGLPHPSGANAHRKKQFEKNKEKLKEQISNWTYLHNDL